MNWAAITPAVIVAAILSIILEWFPGIGAAWEQLSSRRKTMINAALIAIVSGGAVFGNCRLWGATCPTDAWAAAGEIVFTFLLAAAGNQAVHAMTRREVLAY